MNHSPAYILAQHLIAESLLSDPSGSGTWPGFVASLPDGDSVDDDAAALVDTAPVKDGRIMGGDPLFHHGCQIVLRSSEFNAGYSKIDALAAAFADVDDTEVTIESGVTYTVASVTQISGILSLGMEPGTKRRWLFSANFLATFQEV